MAVLNASQRGKLERAVIKARESSYKGAISALESFAVHNKEPFKHMSANERLLRNQLRQKGRLLGDKTKPDGGHTIDKLAYELAYEYWHRMLFARFLEANNLLIHPVHKISVSLEECEELGTEEGFNDKWQAAAYYASKMFPSIFRQDDPLMKLRYATEDRLALEEIIESIDDHIFKADDSLGWVYQYWQTAEKERINAEGNKIDGESIAAVTQLFTEPYMVHFLIDNTLGAWWTARNPGITPPVEFEYLRTLDDGTPAAGNFDGWPDELKDISMLDPAMGSGHFVVEVFSAMAPLRMQAEGLTKEEACDAVIRDNIHGLEIDDRCTQIAAFNLALTAWKFCGYYRELPEMNLACSGIAPKGKKEDWIKLANAEQNSEKRTRLKGGLERMYVLFQQAPELGSLIDPTTIEEDAFTSDFEELEPFLSKALENENDNTNEQGVIAAGIAKAGKLLAKKYVWQITNVPYLSRGKQDKILYDFCKKNYSKSKNDIATVFYEKMIKCNLKGGTSCSVIPQNWLFLTTYKNLRKNLLENHKWDMIARLGPKAFQTPMWDFNVMLISISNEKVKKDYRFMGLDISNKLGAHAKDSELIMTSIDFLFQSDQLFKPDYIVSFNNFSRNKLLGESVKSLAGIDTGDTNRFRIYFWELNFITKKWVYELNSVDEDIEYGGRSNVMLWEDGEGALLEVPGASIRNVSFWGQNGVFVTRMASIPCTLSKGEAWNRNGAMLIPQNPENIVALWVYTLSNDFKKNVRSINQKLSVSEATFEKIPFDLSYWQKVAIEKYPNGLPKPHSNDPTQWLFHGHPQHTESPLQITIARLLGYEWPAENDEEMELAEEAKEKIQAIKALDLSFDEDGIVCIPSVIGEPSAAERMRENIIKIWGDEYTTSTLQELISQEGSKKKDLESYLRDDYFIQHCKLFKNRPFIWHIWDGRKDGFAALVNYHKLNKPTLEKLIYTYLGDWINQCELKRQNNVSGADGLLSAAQKLKEKLLFILEGEPPYDLFIRWKSLSEQPIGWEPDINDGVRLNIYPFVQAGVLRKKFNVKWGKDRGKNPAGSPWGPERWNRYEDLPEEWKVKDEQGNIAPHLTNDIKRKAKEKTKI